MKIVRRMLCGIVIIIFATAALASGAVDQEGETMAEPWLKEQTIDLAKPSPPPLEWDASLGDRLAHTWEVTVLKNGVAVDLTGASVAVDFLRMSDRTTVTLVGAVLGNVSNVTLTQECYALIGDVRGSMRIVVNGAIITAAQCTMRVRRNDSDVVVTPGTANILIEDLLANEAARVAAETIRTAFYAGFNAQLTAISKYETNAFDISTITDDVSITSTGTEQANPGKQSSDYMDVAPGDYNYSENGALAALLVVAFFSEKSSSAYISRLTNVTAGLFAVPSGATYCRITKDGDFVASSRVEKGLTPTAGVITVNADAVPDPIAKTEISLNLFDKTDVTADKFIAYGTGTLQTAAGYFASGWMELPDGTTKCVENQREQLAFYDKYKVYMSGLTDRATGQAQYVIDIPTGCRYIRKTILNANNLKSYQLQVGETLTDYMPYGKRLPAIILPRRKNVVTVSKYGGDYTTIQAAVTGEFQNADNPLTIYLMPGVYTENVDIRGLYVSIVGVNKDTCIIRDDTGDYNNAPVLMSGGRNGLYNLTMVATHTEQSDPAPANASYAVHVEGDGAGTSVISNCRLVSYQHAGLGFGLHDHQTLIVEGCEIVKDDADQPRNEGAVYGHNYYGSGATQQRLIMRDNIIRTTTGTYALMLFDANWDDAGGAHDDAKDTIVTFQRNVLYAPSGWPQTVLNAYTPIAGYLTGYLTLSADSCRNNLALINQPEDGAWITPDLTNSWVAFDANRPPQYRKDRMGLVHWRGMMKNGVIGQAAVSIPTGYRSAQVRNFAVASNSAYGQVAVSSVLTPTIGNNAWVALDGIAPYFADA